MSINPINNSLTSYPTANSSFVNLPESKAESPSSDQHLTNVQDNIKMGKYRLQTFTDDYYIEDVGVWGDKLISYSRDGFKVRDLESGKESQTLKFKETKENIKKILVVNGDKLISLSIKGELKLWGLESGESQMLYKPLFEYQGLICSFTVWGDKLIAGTEEGKVKILDLESGRELQELEGYGNAILSIAVYEDKIIAGRERGEIKIWDLESGQILQTLHGHQGEVQSIAVWEGKIISTSLLENTIKIWDLKSGELLQTLYGHSKTIVTLLVCDGMLISGSSDYTIKIWDLKSGQLLQTLYGHKALIKSLEVYNGRLISCSEDRQIKVWDFNFSYCLSPYSQELLEDNFDILKQMLLAGPDQPIEELAEKLHPDFKQRLREHSRELDTSSTSFVDAILRMQTEVCVEALLVAIYEEDHKGVSDLLEQLIYINPQNAEIYDLLGAICDKSPDWAERAFHNPNPASLLQKEEAAIALKQVLKDRWDRDALLDANLGIIPKARSRQLNVIHLQNDQTAMQIHSLTMDFFWIPTELQEGIFTQLSFIEFRTARLVCKSWKKVIDEWTGIGKGKLTHPQLLQEIQKLADDCVQNDLIGEETITNNERTYIGYNDLIAEACLSYSDALNVYRHLMARKMLLTDPRSYSRLSYDRYVPSYVPLSRTFFADLFMKKVNALPAQKRALCFALYPPRTKINELAVLFSKGTPGQILEKAMKDDYGFDAMKISLKTEVGCKTIIPIALSKDEIEQIKQEVLRKRINNPQLLSQITQVSFFHEQLDREGATSKLVGCPPGTFLMRPSSSSKYDAVISYTTMSGEVTHAAFALIQHEGKPQLFFEPNGLAFETLPKLLDYMSPVWTNPLEAGKEIEREPKAIWSYVYTLPYYFPECKTTSELGKLSGYSSGSKKYVFLFYDAEANCLAEGIWDQTGVEPSLTTSPIDINRFAVFKNRRLDPIGRNEIPNTRFLENKNQILSQSSLAPTERLRYEHLKT